MNKFKTEQEAFEWLSDKVDDPFIDNYRIAYLDNTNQILDYKRLVAKGCCGSYDIVVEIDGKQAKIGCNYGH